MITIDSAMSMSEYGDLYLKEKKPLTKGEKEKKVYEAIQQEKSVREISKEFHVSFTYIKELKKKYGIAEPETYKMSIRSKALKLIDEGKSDLEIAIQLNLSANEVLGFRKEYLILKNEDDFLRIYPQIKDDIPDLLTLNEQLKLEEISPEDAAYALSDNRTFGQMRYRYDSMLKEVGPLTLQVEALRKTKRNLTEDVNDLQDTLERIKEPIFSTSKDNSWSRRVRPRRHINKETQEGIVSAEQLFGSSSDAQK